MSSAAPTNVIFTCDVECSIGNSGTRLHPIFRPWPVETWIWGKLPGVSGEWGINLLMDQLERHGARGTFYVSALEKHFHGDAAVAHVAQEIERRGHETGVHVHCAWQGFATPSEGRRYDFSRGFHVRDSIRDHDEAGQRELLGEAVEHIERWIGTRPVSFRAGNFGADATTLRVLESLGIKTDSSRNSAVGSMPSIPCENAAREVDGVLEIPATTFEAVSAPRQLLRFIDPSNMTLEEARSVFDQVAELGIGTLVLVTHSFQYVSPGHVSGERVAPHQRIVQRVDRILELLAKDDRFRFVTMREAADMDRELICRAEARPRNPAWMTAARLAQSASDSLPTLL